MKNNMISGNCFFKIEWAIFKMFESTEVKNLLEKNSIFG